MFSLRICATVFLYAIVFFTEQTVGQECEFKGSNAGQVRLKKKCFGAV